MPETESKSIKRTTSAALLFVPLLLGAGVGFGAEGDEADDGANVLEEIVVTASRRDETLQNVAMAVSVLEADEYIDAGLFDLQAILPYVPGVYVSEEGRIFDSEVFIRGINAHSTAGVASYIGDIPYGSSTDYAGGGSPLDASLVDLENIQVLKGPQGTLYGASAMGGLIKYETRAASLERWTGSVSADISETRGSGGINQLYRVKANGPLAADRVGLSFALFYRDKTGYIDNIAVPRDNWDDYEYYGGSTTLLIKPTERLTIEALALYQESTQSGAAAQQADLATGEPLNGEYTSTSSSVVPTTFDTGVYGLTIDYDFGAATLRSITSYQERQVTTSLDVTNLIAGLADLFFPQNAPHTQALFTGDNGWDKVTQELRLTSASNQKFEWLVGAYYSKEDGFNAIEVALTPPDPLGFLDVPSEFVDKSFFGTGTFYLTPDLDASVGIRFSDTENTVAFDNMGTLLFGGFPENTISRKDENWLFNVRYRPSENTSFYGRAASGFRPGGANVVVRDPDGNILNEPSFRPDTLWSYELGVKGTLGDGRAAYDLAVFYLDWEDILIDIDAFNITFVGNAAKASSRGVEGSVNVALTDGLTFRATATFIDAQLEEDEARLGAEKGDQLPDSSRWSGALGMTYDFRVAGKPAFVNGTVRYTGETPVGFDGLTDEDGNFIPSPTPAFETPDYTLVTLNAGVSLTERFHASVYVTNLFDKFGWARFQTDISGQAAGIPVPPRTIGLVLRTDF